MGKIYALASIKGGVGKTTIAGNLGVALGQLDREALLVDADFAMGGLTQLLNVGEIEKSLQDLLSKRGRVEDAIHSLPGKTDILPAGGELESYLKADPNKIKDVLDEVKGDYDYVIVDTPPGLSKYNLEPMKASDNCLLTLTLDPTAVSAAEKLEVVAETLDIEMGGAIVNMVDKRSFIDKILRRSKVSLGPIKQRINSKVRATIPYDEDLIKAARSRKPVVVQSPKCDASKAFKKFAKAIPS